MKNALLVVCYIQLLFCSANYCMELPESSAEEYENCLASAYLKIQKWTQLDYEEASAGPKVETKETTSCAYEFGRYQSWPTLCLDDEPGELLKVPFVAAGAASIFFMALGALPQQGILLLCGASMSPCIPCCLFPCVGCSMSTCAEKLDKNAFLRQYDEGKRKGFKETACRECVDTTCSNFREVLKKISEPCFGQSS